MQRQTQLKDVQVPSMWTLEERGGLGSQEGLSCLVVPALWLLQISFPGLALHTPPPPPSRSSPRSAVGHCPHPQCGKTLQSLPVLSGGHCPRAGLPWHALSRPQPRPAAMVEGRCVIVGADNAALPAAPHSSQTFRSEASAGSMRKLTGQGEKPGVPYCTAVARQSSRPGNPTPLYLLERADKRGWGLPGQKCCSQRPAGSKSDILGDRSGWVGIRCSLEGLGVSQVLPGAFGVPRAL